MASGMIRALRRRYPQAYLAWLTQPGPDALLRANAELDEVLVWPKEAWRAHLKAGRWRELAGAYRLLIKTLRERRFDTVVDAQGLLKSGVWAWLSGAPFRLGLGSREASHVLMTRVIERGNNNPRFGSEYIDAAVALGAAPEDFMPRVATCEANHRNAARVLRTALGQTVDEPTFVALAPFTTRPQKHWFDRYWRTLIGELAHEFDWPIVILGGRKDIRAGEAMAARASPGVSASVKSLAGQTSLGETMAVVEQASLLIGVDTGITHMGTAAGRPTVALFGSTRPYTAPGKKSTTILFEPMHCAPCQKHPVCGGRFTCMERLTPARVLNAARWQLARAMI